jgi:hypothetical protein
VIYSFVRAPLVFLPGGLSPDTTLHALNSLNENLQVGRACIRYFGVLPLIRGLKHQRPRPQST